MSLETAYQVLASRLRTAIRAGDYADGRALPTEEQLAAEHSVSRSTVRRAMQDLVAEGAVYRVAGRGTFALPESERYLSHFGSFDDYMAFPKDGEVHCEILSQKETRVDIDAAGRLRLDSDLVVILELRRLIKDTPFARTSVKFPPAVGDLFLDEDCVELTTDSKLTATGLIDRRLPKPIMYVEQSISAVAMPPAIAADLKCDEGLPALRVDRLYSDTDGRPVELSLSYFNPKYYTHRLKLRRSSSA